MKIAYKHLVKNIIGNPSIDEISDRLFQLGHEHEIEKNIFNMEFTPNRGDCLSLNGLLRDLSVFYDVKANQEIYNEAEKKLNIDEKSVFIEHAKGYLNLGEISIIIAVACKHRDEAYVLSRYIIEEIKKRSPIWKKEHYLNKETSWLKGNPIINE